MEEKICKWIQRIAEQEQVPTDIIAFNFGMFESENGYTVYLIGSKEYDANDDDWACNDDFEPKEKYLELSCQRVRDMAWEEFQNSVILTIADCIGNADEHIANLFDNRIITAGFDDGNQTRIK